MRFYNYVLGNETKYYPKKVQEKINAGEGAAMLAIWAVVLIGCKNTLAYGVFQGLPTYLSVLCEQADVSLYMSIEFFIIILLTIICSCVIISRRYMLVRFIYRFIYNLKKSIKFSLFCMFIFIIICGLNYLYNMSILFIFILLMISISHFIICNYLSFSFKIALISSCLAWFFACVLSSTIYKKIPPIEYMIHTNIISKESIHAVRATRFGEMLEVITPTGKESISVSTINYIEPLPK